jgi:predicted nucleic acid-binding protein
MIRESFRCVIDASAGIKLFTEEDYTAEIIKLFEQLNHNSPYSIFVPDIYFAECANIFWKLVRRGAYPADLGEINLARIKALDLPTTPTSVLMERAFQIALEFGISAYAACYVALAERLELPLLTADARLAQVVPQYAVTIESAKLRWM